MTRFRSWITPEMLASLNDLIIVGQNGTGKKTTMISAKLAATVRKKETKTKQKRK